MDKNKFHKHLLLKNDSGEKRIPVNYIVEQKKAYITEVIYKNHREQLDEFFSGSYKIEPIITEAETQGSNIVTIPDESPTSKVRKLEKYVFSDTRTIDILDEFEGINGGEPYEQLVIKNAFNLWLDGGFQRVDIVVERSRNRDYVGDLTFTEFKQGYYSELRSHVAKQLKNKDIENARRTGDMVRFDVPYMLRAQNSRNRSGYGWEWDWSDPYSPTVYEGILYGETTNYIFSGVYIPVNRW